MAVGLLQPRYRPGCGNNDSSSRTAMPRNTNLGFMHGSSCKDLQDGKVKNVSLVFGCPAPTCVPGKEVCDGYDNNCDGQVDDSCVH
jgi:hypothetical protein